MRVNDHRFACGPLGLHPTQADGREKQRVIDAWEATEARSCCVSRSPQQTEEIERVTVERTI
jgi:hypothetical protein